MIPPTEAAAILLFAPGAPLVICAESRPAR